VKAQGKPGKAEVLSALIGRAMHKDCALGCLNPLNWGGKNKAGIVGKKPYSNPKKRPRYGKGQRDKTWENAKDEEGKVYDWKTGKEMNKEDPWDMGHFPTERYGDLHRDYMDGKITKEEFLKRYRDPNNYRPELPSSNRSDNARPKKR
jgi:HNH/ENDO VII superfamily nuclease with conserved GHE residues